MESRKILCFVTSDMADFEIILAAHLLHAVGGREIISLGYDRSPVISQAGFTYLPDRALGQELDLAEVEGLLLPGGPIRPQQEALTRLIRAIDGEQKLLAKATHSSISPLPSAITWMCLRESTRNGKEYIPR